MQQKMVFLYDNFFFFIMRHRQTPPLHHRRHRHTALRSHISVWLVMQPKSSSHVVKTLPSWRHLFWLTVSGWNIITKASLRTADWLLRHLWHTFCSYLIGWFYFAFRIPFTQSYFYIFLFIFGEICCCWVFMAVQQQRPLLSSWFFVLTFILLFYL